MATAKENMREPCNQASGSFSAAKVEAGSSRVQISIKVELGTFSGQAIKVEPASPRGRAIKVEPGTFSDQAIKVEPGSPRGRAIKVEPQSPRVRAIKVEPGSPSGQAFNKEPGTLCGQAFKVEPRSPRGQAIKVKPRSSASQAIKVEPSPFSSMVEPRSPGCQAIEEPKLKPTMIQGTCPLNVNRRKPPANGGGRSIKVEPGTLGGQTDDQGSRALEVQFEKPRFQVAARGRSSKVQSGASRGPGPARSRATKVETRYYGGEICVDSQAIKVQSRIPRGRASARGRGNKAQAGIPDRARAPELQFETPRGQVPARGRGSIVQSGTPTTEVAARGRAARGQSRTPRGRGSARSRAPRNDTSHPVHKGPLTTKATALWNQIPAVKAQAASGAASKIPNRFVPTFGLNGATENRLLIMGGNWPARSTGMAASTRSQQSFAKPEVPKTETRYWGGPLIIVNPATEPIYKIKTDPDVPRRKPMVKLPALKKTVEATLSKPGAVVSKRKPTIFRPKPSAAISKPGPTATIPKPEPTVRIKPEPTATISKPPRAPPRVYYNNTCWEIPEAAINITYKQENAISNTPSYMEEGDIECQICCNCVPMDYMVQCIDGHLFCCECLKNYAKEAVYGEARSHLRCMIGHCDASFPRSQLMRALPDDLMKKYEEKMREEDVNSAGLEGFVKCIYCGYGAVLDPEVKYFLCTQCVEYFCRHCGVHFRDHKGLECSQIEKDDETKIRKGYEEKMSEAKIRTCHKCKSKFTKEDGCNKIICKCGASICYVCHQDILDYSHFCQHVRSPGKDCQNCKSCFLWSNADEDDALAIKEIKKVAEVERKAQGFEDYKMVGVPEALLGKFPTNRAAERHHPYVRPIPQPARPAGLNDFYIDDSEEYDMDLFDIIDIIDDFL